MTTHPAGSIEQHPDIVEMRARYEAAAETPVAQGVNGVIALTGLYLAASPWIVGFSGLTNLTVNNLIVGVALALLAAGFASAYGRTHTMTWVAPVIGIWTIIAPWVVAGDMSTTSTIWSNVVTGAIAVVFGAAAMGVATMRKHV
ncbi:SPW repeat protein [Actinomadura latina]|uniref:SPW repeat protein n=1 Tax=Actinomadura latina TaxID=163603 RepID=A0A846YYW3_9ACTN|nr:SPW repeat protein [Actinomadura latina]NKZ05251.1 SPW repeat protein [Actinomadura latina]